MGGTTNPNGHQDLNAKMFINWKPLTSWKYYELVHSADQKHEDDENACVTSTESLMATRPVRRNPLFFSLWSILLAGLLLSIVAGTLGFLAGRHLPELFPSDFLPGFSHRTPHSLFYRLVRTKNYLPKGAANVVLYYLFVQVPPAR